MDVHDGNPQPLHQPPKLCTTASFGVCGFYERDPVCMRVQLDIAKEDQLGALAPLMAHQSWVEKLSKDGFGWVPWTVYAPWSGDKKFEDVKKDFRWENYRWLVCQTHRLISGVVSYDVGNSLKGRETHGSRELHNETN